MIQFYILLILDAILLQPVRLVLGFIMRFLWHPPKQAERSIPTMSLDEINAIAESRAGALGDKYYIGGDAAKFLGMMYHIHYITADMFLRLFDEDGSVRRNLKDPYTAEEETFSTDMAAGLMLGIRSLKLKYDSVSNMFERTTFKGFPMLFASSQRGKELFGRGHIYRPWWIHGSEDVLTGLAWLRLAYEHTRERRYNIASWVWFILHLPTILLACPDAQIWLGRVYGASWHNTHSKALVFFTGAALGGWFRWVFCRALNYVAARHAEYNLDIMLMSGVFSDDHYSDSEALDMLSDVANKGVEDCPNSTKYLSLFWPPEFVTNSREFQRVTHRGNDYVWERSPVKGWKYDEDGRREHCLDLLFPLRLYKLNTLVRDWEF